MVCIESMMIAMNRLSTVKLDSTMNETNTVHAHGYTSITGRTRPIDQLSSVMIWNRLYIDAPMVPNHSGNSRPNSRVAITEKT